MIRVGVCLLGVLVISPAASGQVGTAQFPGAPAPQAPPRDTGSEVGSSAIRGHVVAADTGQPLARRK
jgi:hypothetical protein